MFDQFTTSIRATFEKPEISKKMTDLRRRIAKWNQEESDESETIDHRPARPMRTASLPNRRRRAPPPPPPGSSQPKSLGPMLRSATGSMSSAQFDADRIEFITSMSQVTIGSSSTEASDIPEEEPPARQPELPKVTINDISAELNEIQLPDDFGNSLVRCVKSSSTLDAHESRNVLRAVLSHLGSRVPPLDRLMDKIMTEFLAEIKFARDAEAEENLAELFCQLEAKRENLHQITNPSDDDTDQILLLLQNILACIRNSLNERRVVFYYQ